MQVNRGRTRWLQVAVALLLIATVVPVWFTAGSANQSEAEVVDLVIDLTFDEIIAEGETWSDASGQHVRGRQMAGAVAGDLTGNAHLTERVFQAGPCAEEACSGRLDRIGELSLVTEDERWRGTFSISALDGSIDDASGVLFERRSGAARALRISTASLTDDGTLSLEAQQITLTGPVAAVTFTQSMCVTGPTTAHGGFLGTDPVDDAGPGRIRFDPLGAGGELGIRGAGRQVGRVGIFQTEYLATRSGDHLMGEFVLAGVSGAYRDLVGFGRMRATISDEPRCDTGREVTTHWNGSVQITFDPARVLPPQVRFTMPSNRSVVSNPILVEADVWHIELKPAGEVREGYGHLHLIVDAPCVAPGETIPEDDEHIHLDDGSSSVEVTLPTGNNRLCLQLGNGDHVATAATDVINIVVESAPDDGGNVRP